MASILWHYLGMQYLTIGLCKRINEKSSQTYAADAPKEKVRKTAEEIIVRE